MGEGLGALVTSVSEARVIECATAIAANVTAIRKLNAEIRAAECPNATITDDGPRLDPCVFRKVEVPGLGPDYEPDEVLPWYHWPEKSAAELGAELDYCPECVRQVDRFRARKVLKAKKGGLVSALVRVVGIMEKKAVVKS